MRGELKTKGVDWRRQLYYLIAVADKSHLRIRIIKIDLPSVGLIDGGPWCDE